MQLAIIRELMWISCCSFVFNTLSELATFCASLTQTAARILVVAAVAIGILELVDVELSRRMHTQWELCLKDSLDYVSRELDV